MELSNQTLAKSIRKLKILFLLTGLRLRGIKSNTILYVFNSAWLNTDILGCMCWLSNGILNGMSFKQISFVAPCLTFSILGDIKAIHFAIHDTKVYQLIDDLITLGKKPSDSGKIDEIKATEINFLNRVIKVFIALTVLTIIIFNVGPLLLTASTYYRTGELKLFLPFLDIYPFDALDLKYWPYVYIHQVWSVCIVLCDACCVDCILFACCTYLRIQFRILQLDITNLIPLKTKSRQINGAQFGMKFRQLIYRHQDIIRLSNVLENVYSILILLNFITSSIVICFTGFNVMIIEDIPLVATFITFLVMSLSQVWSLCYFGELLMTSSAEVSDAVFASQWYSANIDTCDTTKNLRIVHLRAQKPCKLTAFGFADVNLRAFMQILSKAWSYFALLQTIYTP